MELGSGRVVEGRYRIGRCIGRGAFGTVVEAESLPAAFADHGARRVALKVLNGEHASHPRAHARFTHEAYLASRLRHPNLVPVLDYGALEGAPYFAMELLEGATLDRVLDGTPVLPSRFVVALVDGCAQALAALHAHGIVHRDVKPANLFVELPRRRRARVRVIDLGVAGIYDARRARKLGARDVDAAGTHGTPAYLAPEQALGRPVGPTADVYALACVTYRTLTGAQPFAGGSVSRTMHAHIFDEARPPSRVNPTLPRAVDAVFERALDKDPGARTPSVTRFAAELRIALR